MPRFVTVKKAEQERQKAAHYVKNSLVYPSALMGLISLLVGYGAVIYLGVIGRPITDLLTHSLVLLGIGLILGLIQALYQHYLFRSHPDYFADRVRRNELRLSGRVKKLGDPVRVQHSGRSVVPFLYLAGWAGVIFLIVIYAPKLNLLAAIFLILAGFHNARFFYLKRLRPV